MGRGIGGFRSARRRARLIVACAIGIGIALSGCGDDDGDDEQGAPVEQAELGFYDWEPSLAVDRPFPTESAARSAVGPGIKIVRDDSDPDRPQYYALDHLAILTEDDIVEPEAATSATEEPVVTFGFTSVGQRKFQVLTRAVVQRARREAAANPGSVPDEHFAIVVDDEVLALAVLD